MSERIESTSVVVTTAAGETTVLNETGRFYGLIITTDLTNDASVLVEDGTTEVGTFKCPGTDDCRSFMLPVPRKFTTRLDVTVTGTGAQATVFYGL